MRHLKLWYEIHNYQSHRRVASVYKQMLSRRYSFAKSIDEADVVILHLEPHDYESIYNALPRLRNKFVISYCVWEASELPVAYQRSLALVQEVWTCSEYCLSIIKKHHARVFRIPHTIERETASHDVDDAIIHRLISFDPHNYYLLSIGRTLGARTILRSQDPRVFYLPMTFSASQMNALYKAADVYVSAHHSEGWGLTLSDAILFGKPVVATGYSGNLEFMSHDNSFLIRCAENYIREDDVFALFTTQMKWADPNPHHLEEILMSLYKGDLRAEAVQKSKRALEDSKRYSNDSVKDILFERMDDIQQEVSA